MVISMLVIGALSLVAFVLIEWRFSRLPMMPCESKRAIITYHIFMDACPQPYITHAVSTNGLCCVVSIFNNRVVTTLLLQGFLLGAVYQSYLYYLPMYFQNARQYSVLKSASISVALVAMQAVSSITSGQYLSRRKRYGEIIWIGFGLWTL